MFIYFIYVILSLFFIYRETNCSCEFQKRKNFKISLIPLFVILAFKGVTVGSDTPGYFRSYIQVNDNALYQFRYERIEPGYTLFIKILNFVTHNPQFLMIVSAIIICVCIYLFVIKNTDNYCLGCHFIITLGFLQFALTGLRQTLAIAIILLVYESIKKRKIGLFILGIIIATSFHKSVLFFLPSYFISELKFNKRNVILFLIATALSFVFSDFIFIFAAEKMNYNYGIENVNNGLIFLTIVLIITIYGVCDKESLIAQREDNRQILLLNFVSLYLWVLRLASLTAERVSLYYLPFTALLLTAVIASPKKRSHLLSIAAVLLSSCFFLYRISQHGDLSDYQFFFDVDNALWHDKVFNY